jgi:hypothetical protein
VLEEKHFRRLGEVRERLVDIRLVAATHRDCLIRCVRKHFGTICIFALARSAFPYLRCPNGFRLYWGVYVRRVSWLTRPYLVAIRTISSRSVSSHASPHSSRVACCLHRHEPNRYRLMHYSAVNEHPSSKEHVCPRSIEAELSSDGPLVRAWDCRDRRVGRSARDCGRARNAAGSGKPRSRRLVCVHSRRTNDGSGRRSSRWRTLSHRVPHRLKNVLAVPLRRGIGDVLIQPLQKIRGEDWLGFAEIPAAEMRLISKEQQVAEKLHAYTLPRSTPNSRVKDLVDLLCSPARVKCAKHNWQRLCP